MYVYTYNMSVFEQRERKRVRGLGKNLRAHVRNVVPEESNEFLLSVVTGTVPAGGVKVLPESPETDGEPQSEDWVGFLQLTQTERQNPTLETLLLVVCVCVCMCVCP